MSGPDPRPEAVETAAAWIREYGSQFRREALDERLRSQGYSELEILDAHRRAEQTAEEIPGRRDLRATAAVITITGFLGAWALVALPPLLAGRMDQGMVWLMVGILAFILALIGLPTLILISDSKRLRRGTVNTVIAMLAIPFALLVIVAGLCVSALRGGTA
ncbi:MAG: hypothetical protein WCK58_16925 [Chloroflexota bacterium]